MVDQLGGGESVVKLEVNLEDFFKILRKISYFSFSSNLEYKQAVMSIMAEIVKKERYAYLGIWGDICRKGINTFTIYR